MSTILGNPIIAGGGGLELVANVADGATVTATLGSKTVTGVSVGGQARLKIPQEGKWTVSATSGALVSVPQEISVPATIDISFISNELNDNSWAAIKQVSDANTGANFWSVGDCKEVTMNGKVSDGLTLSNYSAWVYIIGFNHNAEREGNGIAFQGFKATKNGTPVCLVDSGYGSGKTRDTWFNMNDSNSTSGGWRLCDMRNKTMPLIKKALPSDLQAVIKKTSVFTVHPGAGIGRDEQEVFLLSEYEVFGVIKYSYSEEKNYCKQYDYYAAGNSKVKYKHNSTGTAANLWERSPVSGSSSFFCCVNASGSAYNISAYNSLGVSPCFKV